jgi:TRAP-type C4-dicarboxylate transport system permease small subunit
MTYLNKLMSYLGGITIGAMMLLVVTEVLCRSLIGQSIEGTIEIVSICLALAIFLGYSPCEQENHHVKVELIVRLLPDKPRFAIDMTTYILAVAIVLISSWQVGLEAIASWEIGETLPGADFQVPVYPAKAVCFIGYVAFLIQLFINLVGIVRDRKSEKK